MRFNYICHILIKNIYQSSLWAINKNITPCQRGKKNSNLKCGGDILNLTLISQMPTNWVLKGSYLFYFNLFLVFLLFLSASLRSCVGLKVWRDSFLHSRHSFDKQRWILMSLREKSSHSGVAWTQTLYCVLLVLVLLFEGPYKCRKHTNLKAGWAVSSHPGQTYC